MNPTNLQRDDHITFDLDALPDNCRVSDTELKQIGITDVLAVTLIADDSEYLLSGTTDGSTYTVERVDTDQEWDVFTQQIERV
jgi:hypothetical protein